jgi:hypothetical protein
LGGNYGTKVYYTVRKWWKISRRTNYTRIIDCFKHFI